ncbi:MAG: hypothetical protein HQK79_07805 [Desulfobacterales bacterium]|nr:hypothetical protein [Desulfobacterales bacterium]
MVRQKLDIKKKNDEILFFINDCLQFSSKDEHIYHDKLVHPAVSILKKRISSSWDALILGGGDGLALRELLKYHECSNVDVVDYDANVISEAKTAFSDLNQKAFFDKRTSIFIYDAWQYLKECGKVYDLIISDFTFPNTLDTCRLFTYDFFSIVKKRLKEHGLYSLNSVSPTRHTIAYWSIYRTLKEIKLNPCPIHLSIPSFLAHGYGEWGFFIASKQIIEEEKNILELSSIIEKPNDLLYLLSLPNNIDRDWALRAFNILRLIDIDKLFDEAYAKIKKLSKKFKKKFNELRLELPNLLKEQILNIERISQILSLLILIIMFVNLLYPDNSYAKGSSGGGGGSADFCFISKRPATPFHIKDLQSNNLSYAVSMQGRNYQKKRVITNTESYESEELLYSVTDDIFITPSGKVYLMPQNLSPCYYQMTSDNFVLMCEGELSPIITFTPDDDTINLLIENLSLQIKALDKTIEAYNKWLKWTSPMIYISENSKKEYIEIERLNKIHNAMKIALAHFGHYRTGDLASIKYSKLSPGLYVDHNGIVLFWCVNNEWKIYSWRGNDSNPYDFPVISESDKLNDFINKVISSPKNYLFQKLLAR